jgi:hypothetical protein
MLSTVDFCVENFSIACNLKIKEVNSIQKIFPENIDFGNTLKQCYYRYLNAQGIGLDEYIDMLSNSFLYGKFCIFENPKVIQLFLNCKSEEEKIKLIYYIINMRYKSRVFNLIRDRKYDIGVEYPIETVGISEDHNFNVFADEIRKYLLSLGIDIAVKVFDLVLEGCSKKRIAKVLSICKDAVDEYLGWIQYAYIELNYK